MLTFAIGVALSPLAVIAVILMLVSRRARTNGLLFLLGWVVTLAVVSGVVYVVSHEAYEAEHRRRLRHDLVGPDHARRGPSPMASRSWLKRPSPGTEPELPKWLASVEDLKAARAFGLAVLLAGVKPKNLILSVGAAGALARLDPTPSEAAVALAVFLVGASLSVAVPVVAYLVSSERAEVTLESLKSWLLLHHAAMMTVLLLVFGVYMVGNGWDPGQVAVARLDRCVLTPVAQARTTTSKCSTTGNGS